MAPAGPAEAATGASTSDGLTVQIAPSSLTLGPGDVGQVGVVITNTMRTPVSISGVDIRTPPRVVVERAPDLVAPGVIPVGGLVRGDLEVRALAGVQDGEIAVLTEYRSTGPAPTRRVVATSLAIKAGPAAGMPELTFVAAPETLNDGQSRLAVVRVANPTPFAYRQITIFGLNGDDLDLAAADGPAPPFTACAAEASIGAPSRPIVCLDRLPSGASHVVDLRVSAHDSVHTGKQRIGVVFTGTRDTGTPEPLSADVVSTADVEVAVFGVDALSPFGIGTLFVLPGLLAVLVFLLLARGVYPRKPGLPDTVDLKDLRALPIVVPLAALAYLIIWWALGRDLTEKVGTIDVALLFGLGMVLGLAVWAVMAVAWYRHSGRKQFTAGDSPETVLRRLDARRARLTLPAFTTGNLLYLRLAPAGDGKLLAAPRLSYAFTEKMAADDGGRSAFQAAVQNDDISAVRRSHRTGEVTMKWTAPTGVATFDSADIQTTGDASLLVETQ